MCLTTWQQNTLDNMGQLNVSVNEMSQVLHFITVQRTKNVVLDLWFIPHHWCIRPHGDATNVCLELMLQPLPRSIPFFGGPSLPHLSISSLACQVFSWIPQHPSAALASECVLHPFSWHDQAIASFFRITFSRSIFPVLLRTSSFVTLSLQVIPRMPLNHLWCAASSVLLNVTLRGHTSAPQRRVDRISASYSLSFVCRLMCLKTFFILPNIADAFPIRTFTSFSQLPFWDM